tara:strand:+ start:3164 stop:4303 length:1140 start_codon:yes stop_codon:yes gene_type:complete
MSDNLRETQSKQLILLFSKNGKLSTWKESGYLKREETYYQNLLQAFNNISWITYGVNEDTQIRRGIKDITVLNNENGLTTNQYINTVSKIINHPQNVKKVLKTNQLSSAYHAYKIHRATNIPYIIRCGNVRNYWILQKKIKNKVVNWIQLKIALTYSSKLIVPTKQEAQYAQKLFILPKSKIAIIPNFVPTDIFKPNEKPVKQKHLLGFVGNFKTGKNLPSLIKGLSGLPDIKLRLIGNGPQIEQLKSLAKLNGVNLEIIPKQLHEKLPSFLNECEAFVFPSFFEGHPKALLEAMACELPVITTPVYGIKNLIEHKKNGFLCSNTSPQAIREAILEVLQNKALANKMAKTAREFVVNNFSLQNVINKEIKIYKDLNILN